MIITNTNDDAVYTVMYEDIEGDQQFFNIIAILILAGSAAAAVNLTARMVDQTRREIGISMALGVKRRWIALRPMLMGVQISLLGVVLGVLMGWTIADLHTRLPRVVPPHARMAHTHTMGPLPGGRTRRFDHSAGSGVDPRVAGDPGLTG